MIIEGSRRPKNIRIRTRIRYTVFRLPLSFRGNKLAFSDADTAIVLRDSGGREGLSSREPLGKPYNRNSSDTVFSRGTSSKSHLSNVNVQNYYRRMENLDLPRVSVCRHFSLIWQWLDVLWFFTRLSNLEGWIKLKFTWQNCTRMGGEWTINILFFKWLYTFYAKDLLYIFSSAKTHVSFLSSCKARENS
jgi:hypothetical protein